MSASTSASAGPSRSSGSNFRPGPNHPATIVKKIMSVYRTAYIDTRGCQHGPLKDRVFSGDAAIDENCKAWLIADAYERSGSWKTFCSRYDITEAMNTMEKLLIAVVRRYRDCTTSFPYLRQPCANTHHFVLPVANVDGVCYRRIMREYHQGGVSVDSDLQVYQFPPWKNLRRSRSVKGIARKRLNIGDWTVALGGSDNFCRTFNIDPDRTNESGILKILGDRAKAQEKQISQMVRDLSSPSQLAVGPELTSQPFRRGTRTLLKDWESVKKQLGDVKAGEDHKTQQRRKVIAYIEENGLERLIEDLPGLRDQPTFQEVDRLTRKNHPWYVKRPLSDDQKEQRRLYQQARRAGQNASASAA